MEDTLMEYDFKEILDIGLEIEFSNIKRETPSFQDSLHRYLSNTSLKSYSIKFSSIL